MRSYPFWQVDAFTDRPLTGNACAVLLDADDLDERTMLAVAREMNLSETAFVRRSEIADFGVRYFTPAEEIPLAGHPTIATVHALIEAGRLSLAEEVTTISLELKVGPIPVEIRTCQGAVESILMTQKRPLFQNRYRAEDILPIFGLSVDDALPEAPIQTVSTGTPQLMVPVRSLEALRRAWPEVRAYQTLRQSGDFFSIHLFCLQGVEQGRTFARHFVIPPDVIEDAFTGSATGGMAAYLWRYGLLSHPSFIAEQGHWLGRPGQAVVEVIGPPEDIQAVRVGGKAATVIRGVMDLR